MRPLYSILDRPWALILLVTALFLVIGQTAAFLISLQEKKSGKQLRFAALHLLAGFMIFVVILDGFDNVNFLTIPRDSVQTEWFVFSLPWVIYAGLEALSAAVLVFHFREYRRYKTDTVTPEAIRQAVDLLPEGISVSAEDGTVRLANLKMDALCRELTGERLSDARAFRAYIKKNEEEQSGKYLIHTPRGEVWLFEEESLSIDGQHYERTSAVNATGQYRITEELREKNEHLQEIQRRMRKASELSGEMFVYQEKAGAHTALHNELGQVLLMGRHYIEHPDTTDAAVVALMTGQMNSFLLGENKASMTEPGDKLRETFHMADSIGVSVEMQGEPPRAEKLRSLLAAAIRECAANAVKHAEGDRLFVRITEKAADTVITVTNNGKPPKGPIDESGGLLSLRRSVEAAGGQMHVEYLPSFSLTLTIGNS